MTYKTGPRHIKKVTVTFDDNLTQTIEGSGVVMEYDTEVKIGSSGTETDPMRIAEVYMRVDSK